MYAHILHCIYVCVCVCVWSACACLYECRCVLIPVCECSSYSGYMRVCGAAGSLPLVVFLQVPRLPLPPGPRAAVQPHHAVLAHPGRQAGLHHHHGGNAGGSSVHSEHSSRGTTSLQHYCQRCYVTPSQGRGNMPLSLHLFHPPVFLHSPVHKGVFTPKERCKYIQSQCENVNTCKCSTNG